LTTVLEDFARLAREQKATIEVSVKPAPADDFLQPDALLQTPLIAFCLLVMAYRNRRGIEAAHTAGLTSAVFSAHFAGLGNARSRLAWSPAMRLKCADALAELEVMKLITVIGIPRRFLLTDQATNVIREILRGPPSELSRLARGLRHAFEDVEAKGLSLL
jgi:hypothetical protein